MKLKGRGSKITKSGRLEDGKNIGKKKRKKKKGAEQEHTRKRRKRKEGLRLCGVPSRLKKEGKKQEEERRKGGEEGRKGKSCQGNTQGPNSRSFIDVPKEEDDTDGDTDAETPDAAEVGTRAPRVLGDGGRLQRG